MSADIARFYQSDKNPDGAHYPGVPLRDLTQEEFDGMPEWLQRSVDASPFYRKTRPRAEPAAEPVTKSKQTTDAPAKE